MSNNNSFWHQNVFTNTKSRIIFLVILGIVFILFAVLIWANQAGKLTLKADSGSPDVMKITSTCVNGYQTDIITWDAYPGATTYSVKVYNGTGSDPWVNIPACYQKPGVTSTQRVCSYSQHAPHAWNYRVIAHTSSANVLFGEERAVIPTGCGGTTATPTPTVTATPTATQTAQCTTGEKRCNGDVPQTCMSGSWASAHTSCALTGQTCQNGECIGATATPTVTPTATSTPTSTVTTLRPPTDVKAELQTDNTSVKITGKYSHALTNSYKIYNADNNQLIKQVNATTIEGTGEILTGLKCATTYRYYLIASGDIYDQANDKFIVSSGTADSSASDIVSVTTPTCGIIDSGITDKTPAGLVATASQSNIQLNWEAVTGASGYDIYNCNNQFITSTSDTSYTFTGLPCNTDYCYYVKAHDASGKESKASSQVTTTTSACSNTGQTTSTSSTATVAQLVSTGSSLWINILIAIILTAAIGYFIFRDELFSRK